MPGDQLILKARSCATERGIWKFAAQALRRRRAGGRGDTAVHDARAHRKRRRDDGARRHDPSDRHRRSRRPARAGRRGRPVRRDRRARARSARAPPSAPHAVIDGHTRIGRDNRIFQFASLGEAPQDKKYAGEPTRLEIGDRNTSASSARSTAARAGRGRHAARRRQLDHGLRPHRARLPGRQPHHPRQQRQLAGHVERRRLAILGGFTGVHQFCRIGAHAMTGVGSVVLADVPPYVMATGNTARPAWHQLRRTEAARLQRARRIAGIRRGYKTLYNPG